MQYSEGRIGRVFVLRMDHGEDLIESLQKFLKEKNINSCMALFLGALLDGRAVTGPKEPVVPPTPNYEAYDSAWEVFGMATVYPSKEGPKMHIHSGMGRGRQALVGCIRDRAKIYLIVEAVLFEICDLTAERLWDEKMELFLLSLKERL
ncbi:MAG TPA: DNA-binding protein [Methanothrix sp.]|nr:DNA-binding protein [Methanothrix sp.]HPT38438.1 DNA-binding protein [Methanothrix sp.]